MTRKINTQTYLFDDAVPTLAGQRLVFDYFAGAGGASTGIEQALGRSPDVAINHCEHAVRVHELNHPQTKHVLVDVWDVDPRLHLPAGDVEAAWFSPDCTHHSRAKGGKPVNKRIRGLAWVVCRVAKVRRPSVIFLENVPEFASWGPLDADGRPIKEKSGQTFRAFVRRLERLGYVVEWRTLNAADHGAPTSRKRLFLVARNDGKPIVWPEPTHGPGRAHPHRSAAECIDWSIPCPSIFGRARPLAPATCKRIADGLRRFVVESPRPYLAPLSVMPGKAAPPDLVAVWLAKHYGGVVGHGVERPIGTITAVDHHSLVACHLSRVPSDGGPAPDVVAAWLTKYYGQGTGQDMNEPMHTVVSKDRFGLVTVRLDGETYAVVDIGLRMLTPRELARAQGFDDSFKLVGSQKDQVARIGNSVVPQVARALVAANVPR